MILCTLDDLPNRKKPMQFTNSIRDMTIQEWYETSQQLAQELSWWVQSN
jgi:hypothetical protein